MDTMYRASDMFFSHIFCDALSLCFAAVLTPCVTMEALHTVIECCHLDVSSGCGSALECQGDLCTPCSLLYETDGFKIGH